MRLAGQVKGGFYPIPPRAVAAVLRHINVPKVGAHLIDPCAGEGAALLQLAQATGAKPYAVELDEGRAAVVRDRVPDCLAPCSAFGVKKQGYWDWLWLNPPYDDEVGGGGRVEHKFLAEHSHWLRTGGVLCFVVPEQIIGSYSPSLTYLRERYDEVFYLPFPDECRRFREVVAFGYKRDRSRELDYYQKSEPCRLMPDDMVYHVPTGPGPRLFEKYQLTDEELGRALASSPLQKHLKPPPPLSLPRPPLPPAKGHLAMLLASGHMDGLVRPEGEPPHVVRGTAVKEQYLKEESTDEKEDGSSTTKQVFAEKIVLSVRVLDSSGAITTLKQE